MREQTLQSSEIEKKQIEKQITNLFIENKHWLFPNAFDSTTAKELVASNNIIAPGGISNNSFFDINPMNWALRSFSLRVRSSDLQFHKEGILSNLNALHNISKENNEPAREITNELNFETRLTISKERK